jgi:hypothetical protein
MKQSSPTPKASKTKNLFERWVDSQFPALVSRSAHAWLTPLTTLSLPGIVAAPFFSMNEAFI